MTKSPGVVYAGTSVSGSEASDTDTDKALYHDTDKALCQDTDKGLCQDSASGARRHNVD